MGAVVAGVVEHDGDRRGPLVMSREVLEQLDHRLEGDQLLLAMDQSPLRPRQGAIDVEAAAAVVRLQFDGRAFAQPTMGGMAGVGGVGGINEIERSPGPAASISGFNVPSRKAFWTSASALAGTHLGSL